MRQVMRSKRMKNHRNPGSRRSGFTLIELLLVVAILGLASALFTGSSLQAAEPKLKEYPLKICLVSDNKLGSMGKPYKFTHEEQRVELCCKPCLKKFTKEPVKYLKKLEPKKK